MKQKTSQSGEQEACQLLPAPAPLPTRRKFSIFGKASMPRPVDIQAAGAELIE
jgi:hypothetical protein